MNCAAGCDNTAFQQLQQNVDSCCGAEGAINNSLCRAIAVGNAANTQPISCLINLINEYMTCGKPIPPEKITAAYEAFVQVTGYQPPNVNGAINYTTDELNKITMATAFFVFFPMMILLVALIWILVALKLMDWGLGLFLTVVVVVLLYVFAILYRQYVQSTTKNLNNNLKTINQQSLANQQQTIAYTNQGLMAAACAITCQSGTKCWTCNSNEPASSCLPCKSAVNNKKKK